MNTKTYIALILSFVIGACIPAVAGAESLGDQIDNLQNDADFKNQLAGLKELDTDGLAVELDDVAARAKADLEQVQAEADDTEKESLQKHFEAVSKLASNFRDLADLKRFGDISINQFILDDSDDCVVADSTYDNHTVFDCDAEYKYAIKIWRRTEIVNRILNTWKREPRIATLNRIKASEQRWENFSTKVTSDQFIWETLVNGWLISGTIDTPPRKQYRLLHPVALLSYSEDSEDYNEELGVEVIGLRTYDEQYNPEWGLSIFALLESENATETGYGVSLSRKNFTFGVVVQDTEEKDEDTKILLGYNLAGLFENTKNELADRKTELLEQLKIRVREFQ